MARIYLDEREQGSPKRRIYLDEREKPKTFTPISEFPKMPLSERLKSIARPVGGFLREAGGSVYAPLAEATTGLPRKIMGKEPLQKVNFLGQDFRTPSGAGKEAGQAFAEGKIKKGLGIAGGSAFDVITLGWGGAFGTIGKQTTKALIKRGIGKGTATALGVGTSLAPLGAGYGATGAMEQEQGVGGIIKSAGTGALLATGLGFGGVKLSEAITKRIAKKAETIVDDLEIEIKEKATPEQKKAIENALQDGVGEQEIKELVVKSKERQIVENIAQEQDPVKISSLLKDKIAKEDIPTLSKSLKHIDDPDQVARLLDEYNPDTINAKLADDLALADTAQQIKAILKGKASKEVIEEVTPILKSLDDPKAIANIIEEFQISLKKVASDIDEISTKAEPTVKTLEPEVKPKAKDPLVEEAKKYKSEEEFVRAQGTRTGVEVRDKIGTKLQDPYTAEYLPTNSDGTITLYHSTTKEGAEKIKQSGIFGSKTEGGDIYFTTNKKGYGGIGKDKDVVLAFNVDPRKIKFDDVYRGELHLKGNNTDIGGIKPVVIKTKSQLTDIWKQAQEELKAPKAVKPEPTPKEAPKNEYSKLKENIEKKKESKYARGVQEKALEKGIIDKMEDVAEYTPNQRKEQARLSAEVLVDNDRTLRILRGEEPLPSELLAEGFTKSLENYIMTLDNIPLAQRLTYELTQSPLATQVSETASALSMRVGIPENSPLKITKQIESIRKEVLENKGIDVKKATKTEEKAIQSKIKDVDEAGLKKFINDIKC